MMDYIEAFKNLSTNNKYGRKSPHKAVMMLTVIELYERNILVDNEIYYNDNLKDKFLDVWNDVLPNEHKFHPDAYLPFWYLQSDSFWHIVPVRGEENVLSLMRDTHIKPSETILRKAVLYAELDENLFFLMTIPSGRKSLKRVLLENYTNLSEKTINKKLEFKSDTDEKSVSDQDEYEKTINLQEIASKEGEIKNELESNFLKLSKDLQIALNYEYYSYLKHHREERGWFLKLCPSVFNLYDHIARHPLSSSDIDPVYVLVYESFLYDLRISLMSEDCAFDVVDSLANAIECLHDVPTTGYTDNHNRLIADENENTINKIEEATLETTPTEGKRDYRNNYEVEHVYLDSSYNIVKTITTSSLEDAPEKAELTESRKGKPWTQEEEQRITHYFERGISTADIAERIGRTEVAIKARLAKLGLIEYTYGQDEPAVIKPNGEPASPDDFQIENDFTKAYILNKRGEKVFSTDGKLKRIGGKIYRINLKNACFTIKDMVFNGEVWMKGTKKIVAYPQAELYRIMDDAYDYGAAVEDIVDCSSFEECKLKVNGVWYDNQGNLITDSSKRDDTTEELPKQKSNYLNIIKHPLYAVRKQAILRAMGYFRLPAKIRDIARTISRTAWGAPIKEDDVEEIISTINEVESVDDKYILRKK
ncbi:MAG: hypothetical protein IJ559_05270 [Prevotella sp.]|nr:hypothetical protein [Prevotella sp.]